MIEPNLPENERERLQALRRYDVLDTPPERAFDDITWLASKITGAPIALVSLVDADRQWFKSKQGLEAPETSRAISFCGHAICHQVPLQITNALEDMRFFDNPLVTGPPHIRFYLGIPLTNPDGFNLGTLCVIDNKARELDDETTSMLTALARQVVSQLELRLAGSELRRQAHIAHEANLAKSRFLANMSHEIRTPMNAVIGMTDVLLDTSINEDQRNSLGIVKRSARSLLRLLNDILDLSKIEAGKLELEQTSFDLRNTLKQAVSVNRPAADEKGLDLMLVVDESLPGSLVGDPIRLEQVLINLAANAVKFTAEGRITVSANIVESSSESMVVEFSVTDSGIGIASDKQERIFEAFTQADGSTTRLFGGTGLGLTISAQLVAMMDGKLQLDSKPGEGSSFFFSIPLNTPSRNQESSKKSDDYDPDIRGDLLVVEDNRINQMVIRRLLEKNGHKVTLAEDSSQAMAAVRSQRFQLILMDIQLPEVDGIETTAMIRAFEELRGYRTPIIALTAHAMKGYREYCLENGLDGYIAKPVDKKKLKEVVASFLSRNRIGD